MSNPANDDAEDSSEGVARTVTLTDRDLRAAARLLNVLAGAEVDRGKELTRIVEKGARTDRNSYRQLLEERARQTFANRAQRSQFFNSVMFGEAAWDMLLALYVTDQSGPRHTVSGLVSLSGVPQTTALRWLDFLDEEQLVTRRANPNDKRVFYVELTDAARGALDAYFSGTMTTDV